LYQNKKALHIKENNYQSEEKKFSRYLLETRFIARIYKELKNINEKGIK
jgi:hypothetical protein